MTEQPPLPGYDPHALIITDMEWSPTAGFLVTFEAFPSLWMAMHRAWNWMHEGNWDTDSSDDPPSIDDITVEIDEWNENTDSGWIHIRPIKLEDYP